MAYLIEDSGGIFNYFAYFFIFSLGFLISGYFANIFKVKLLRAYVIYLWHTLFAIFYGWYTINFGGDSVQYYLEALYGEYTDVPIGIGTVGVAYLVGFLFDYLNLNFFAICLVFNIFGTIGLLGFDGCLAILISRKTLMYRWLLSVYIFLPSISFWSAGIGKDSISFMAIGFALFASTNVNRHFVMLVWSILLMLFVRPHIAAILFASFSIAYLFSSRVSRSARTLGLITIGISTLFLAPFVYNYIGFESFDLETLQEYVELRQGYNANDASGVNLSEMSFLSQLSSYLFRPSLIEGLSMGIFGLVSAAENTLLIILAIIAFYNIIFRSHLTRMNRSKQDFSLIFLASHSLVTWTILAITTANIGIAIRQKWMFVPMIIIFLMIFIGEKRANNIQTDDGK
jgi:hypothetical protein